MQIGGEDLEPLYENKSRFEELTLGWAIFNDQDYIVQQFTGLQDKSGKDIYEGDILHYRPFGYNEYKSNVEVPSFPESYHWLSELQIMLDKNNYPDQCDIEVVGNIFENPEILKNEQR